MVVNDCVIVYWFPSLPGP